MKRTDHSRGYTLIELLLVISIAVILMMVNVGWIHQTMKFSSLMDQRQRHHRELTRLAWDLRDDVHHCNSLSMDGANRLVLAGNDGAKITYTISVASLHVERSKNQKMIQREKFDLSPNSKVYWEASELPDWISLIVARGRTGLAEHPQEKSERHPIADNSFAADLHVRVGPNRWKTTEQESAEVDEEGSE